MRRPPAPLLPFAVTMADTPRLEGRVRHLLNARTRHLPLRARRAGFALALLMAAALAGARPEASRAQAGAGKQPPPPAVAPRKVKVSADGMRVVELPRDAATLRSLRFETGPGVVMDGWTYVQRAAGDWRYEFRQGAAWRVERVRLSRVIRAVMEGKAAITVDGVRRAVRDATMLSFTVEATYKRTPPPGRAAAERHTLTWKEVWLREGDGPFRRQDRPAVPRVVPIP